MSEDDWLNVETESENASGPAVAAILESVADSLRQAPDGTRFDFELEVLER